MLNVLNIDGATRLDITGLYNGFKWMPIIFEHFDVEVLAEDLPDESTPFPITQNYIFLVSKDVNETDVRLQTECVSEENKITVPDSGNVILKPGQYYYSISNEDDSFPLYYGILTINHKKQPWS